MIMSLGFLQKNRKFSLLSFFLSLDYTHRLVFKKSLENLRPVKKADDV